VDQTEMRIALINKELEESFSYSESQHVQIKWFIQLHLLALFGFFSLAGFLHRNSVSGISSLICLSSAIAVFGIGWILLTVLAHKISMILLINKHISTFRNHRLQVLGDGFRCSYVYPTDPSEALIARSVNVLPYIFFAANYMVLCGSSWFFIAQITDNYIGFAASISIGVLVGIFYPRTCVTFYKHLRAAKDALSFSEKHKIEDRFEDARKQKDSPQKALDLCVFFLLALSAGFSVYLVYLMAIDNPILSLSGHITIALGNGLLFGALRYLREKVKRSDIGVCINIIRHKK